MRKFRFIILAVLFVITIGGLVVLNNDSQVHSSHLDGSDFKPGRIIDDSVMANSSTMDTAQIQRFLENMVRGGSCDTWGERDHTTSTEAPYTCLYEYKQNPDTGEDNYGDNPTPSGAIPASRIIYNASQKYDINPQALLVLLQKEQGLITDDWPWEYQYRSATGFGCPDTAECDEEYYGFYNQVDQAAKYFRDFLDDTRGYNYYPPGNNDILYHPDHSCGSSQVNIENRATSALYNYTPYQPNQAALDSLYTAASGSGSECAAYGNRNFWRDFTEWFGSTTFPLLFRIEDSDNTDKVYLSWGDYYYHVASRGVIKSLNLDGIPIEEVSSSELSHLEEWPSRLESVVKFKDNPDPIYQIDQRKLYHFAGLQTGDGETYASGRGVFNAYGHSNPGDIAEYPASLRQFFYNKNDVGKMSLTISARGKDKVYFVKNGHKHPIPSRAIYENMRENIEGHTGCPTYSNQPRLRLSSHLVDNLSTGNKRRLAASNGDPNYIVVNGKLRQIDSADRQRTWGLKDSVFTPISDACKQKFGVGEEIQSNAVRVDSRDKVYKIVRGGITLRHHIASREALDAYTEGLSSVVNLPRDIANLITVGSSKLYAPGKLVQRQGEDSVYMVTDQFARRHITSKELLKAYGFTFDDVVRTNSFQRYSKKGPLFLAADNDDTWLINKKVKRLIPSAIKNEYPGTAPWDDPQNEMVENDIPTKSDLDVYVRGTSEPDPVYKIENGQKREYTSREAFENDSDNPEWGDIIQLSDPLLDPIPEGDPITE